MSKVKVNFLSNRIPWFGKYSGYERLIDYFPENILKKDIAPKVDFTSRVLGKYVSTINNLNQLDSFNIAAEYRFLNSINPSSFSHVLYLDQHLKTLSILNKKKRHIINGTIHLPISQWNLEELKYLSEYSRIFLLYEKDINIFENFTDRSKIRFIHHGVDNTFFRPIESKENLNLNKILIVGHYLRDFELLEKTFYLIQNEISNQFQYHFIIPSQHRNNKHLIKLSFKKNVFFHENLSDEEMLKFYQESFLMLMPMKDSGANTAIVQAISCGLPIITNDVGGIRNYGGGAIFPIGKENDPIDLASIFQRYTTDIDYRNEISGQIRKFSVETLDWHLIAKKHLEEYL